MIVVCHLCTMTYYFYNKTLTELSNGDGNGVDEREI